MLAVIEKVVLALGCRTDVLRQDQDSKGNQLLIDLFKNTHSDEGFEIFEPITYKELKKEEQYEELCLEAGGPLPFEDATESKKEL